MATVTENPKGTRGTVKYNAEGREYTRSFLVEMDAAPTYSNAEVLVVAGLPAIGDAHPQDAFAYCMELGPPEPAVADSTLAWIVRATYRTLTLGQDEAPGGDPWEDAWQIDWNFESYEVAVAKDVNDVAIKNSAADPFDPPLTQDEFYLTVTVNRNSLGYGALTSYDHIGAVNSIAVNILGGIFPARTARLLNWSARRALRNGVVYWQETIKLIFNVNTWDREVLDVGLYAFYSSTGGEVKRRIMVGDQDATEPQRLDGQGHPISEAIEDVYLTFQTYKERNLAILGLAL